MEPFIIQHKNRKAVIIGASVKLYRVKTGNRKKPVDVGVWPESSKGDAVSAWNTATLAVMFTRKLDSTGKGNEK